MNESDIQLKLLANVPIDIEGIGQFQLPTIKEIIQMGESHHQKLLNHLTFSKSSLSEPSDEIDKMSDIQLLLTYSFVDEKFRENLFDSFRLFLNCEPKMYENGLIYFDELSEEHFLTEEKWEFMKKVAKIGNFVQEKKEDEYKLANSKAKELFDFIKRKQKPQKVEEKNNLHSILSAVSWRTNGIDSLLDKTIYQLYDGVYRLKVVDNYHQVFTGIYTGNIDQSKIKLPDLDWANVINIK